jgi:PAS domain S-box-containing protein
MIDAIDRPQMLSPSGFTQQSGPIRVLLVEDEAAHIRIAQRAFASRDASEFELQTAGSIAAATESIARGAPDLVIADVILPDGRGLDLIPPQDTRKYGVVIMTAQGDETTAVEALKRGALDYVVKSADTLVGLPDVALRAMRVWEHIEARRVAEQRLRDEERRLRAVLDAVPDLILVISQDGVFTECRGGRTLFGDHIADELVGLKLMDVVSPETLDGVSRGIHEVVRDQVIRQVLLDLKVRGGRRVVDARIAPYTEGSVLAIVRDVTDRHLISSRMSSLSDREREVLRMVAGGSSNKQIAARLDLSIKTVEAHRSRLMKKLGARNMAELMQLAMTVKEDL